MMSQVRTAKLSVWLHPKGSNDFCYKKFQDQGTILNRPGFPVLWASPCIKILRHEKMTKKLGSGSICKLGEDVQGDDQSDRDTDKMSISPLTSRRPDAVARNGRQAKPALSQPTLPPDIQVQIGRRLVAAYEHVLHQPVPDRFRLLLDELDRKSWGDSCVQPDGLPDIDPESKGGST